MGENQNKSSKTTVLNKKINLKKLKTSFTCIFRRCNETTDCQTIKSQKITIVKQKKKIMMQTTLILNVSE